MKKVIKFYMDLLGIKYKYTKGIDKYPKGSNLCSTVTLMHVTGLGFEDTFDLQTKVAKENYAIMNSFLHVIKPILEEYGYERCHNITEKTIGEFMYNHKKGKYVILGKDHIEYYANGTRYLVPRSSNDSIRNLDGWIIEPIKRVYMKV